MKVAVTGGTGFVGSHVVSALLEQGYQVRLLARKPQSLRPGMESVLGSMEKYDSLLELVEGCDAVVHLVGIIREFPPAITYEALHTQATLSMLKAAREKGVNRFIHMSALGSAPDSRSAYHRTKFVAEKAVQESGLDYTIFKPSVIFGPRDEFINLLLSFLKLPAIPVIGDGKYQLQPVAVDNIAQAFARCIESPAARGRTYEVGGPRRYTYDELLDALAALRGKGKPLKVHQPVSLVDFSARLFGRFPFFPISSDQLHMLLKGSTTSETAVFDDLNITPCSLEEKFAQYYGQ